MSRCSVSLSANLWNLRLLPIVSPVFRFPAPSCFFLRPLCLWFSVEAFGALSIREISVIRAGPRLGSDPPRECSLLREYSLSSDTPRGGTRRRLVLWCSCDHARCAQRQTPTGHCRRLQSPARNVPSALVRRGKARRHNHPSYATACQDSGQLRRRSWPTAIVAN